MSNGIQDIRKENLPKLDMRSRVRENRMHGFERDE